MAQTIVTQLLLKERERLIDEMQKMKVLFKNQIREIETAIDQIEGKQVWDYGSPIIYDDNNPDYIKGSIED